MLVMKMASAADYATSVGATIGAEIGLGGKFGSQVAAGASINPVSGTIGQDYYTVKVIYPEGISINPEDGTTLITKPPSPRTNGDKLGTR